MICAKHVFQCFRWLERVGDRLTGAAGPVFVTLGVVLLSIGVFCFCERALSSRFRLPVCTNCCASVDVVQPSVPLPWLSTPICALIAFNLLMHYYWVCTVSPGFVTDPPQQARTGWFWARKRQSAKHRALTGVRWSEDVNITKAAMSECRKCKVMRPEVSIYAVCWTETVLNRLALRRGPTIVAYATVVCSSMITTAQCVAIVSVRYRVLT